MDLFDFNYVVPLALLLLIVVLVTWRFASRNELHINWNDYAPMTDHSILYTAKVHAIVNPISGSGFSTLEWNNIASTAAKLCDVTTYVTTRIGHAKEIAEKIDKNRCDQIVIVVGGDGMLGETMCGLFAEQDRGKYKLNEIALAILPAGSGNGVAKSLNISSAADLAKSLVTGNVRAVDLMTVDIVKESVHEKYVSILSVAFGAIADYDCLAEREFRWLGWTRSSILPIYIISKLCHYRARLWWRTSPSHEAQSITDEFFMIHACNMPWMASDALVAPACVPGDGVIHLVVMSRVTRYQALRMFLAAQTGEHVLQPWVTVIKCVQFGIQPLCSQSQDGTTGRYVIDGNLANSTGDIAVTKLHHAATMFAN